MSAHTSPYVYFGGKHKVSPIIWRALGDVSHFVDPFMGSNTVLLDRPAGHKRHCETVNDKDRFLSNTWRAIKADPDGVAKWADDIVSECDLHAKHLWLITKGRKLLEKIDGDPEYYNTKVAGWWLWGINVWIGSGWCQGNGCWTADENGRLVKLEKDDRKRPHLSAGQGINRKRPHLSAGQGINRQLPHLGNAGQGINRQRPHLGSAGRGEADASSIMPKHEGLYQYMRDLAHRLRRVRICCGDWKRVVTDGALSHGDTIGVFLDPPYLGTVRTKNLYMEDDHTIANEVREWCIEHGDNPKYRIVLAGYETEHGDKMPKNWTKIGYKASTSYGTKATAGKKDGGNQGNRRLERLWMSPFCNKTGREGLGI